MDAVLDWFTGPLRYQFMQRALIEVVLMGAVTGAVGCYVVLRGLSFIGDALSHAIFPGVVIAYLLGQSIFIGAMAFGVMTSTAITVVATNRRIKEDSAIGVLFAGTFALGIVLISSSNNFTRDLASFLFGNVLGATTTDIWVSAGAGLAVILFLVLFHRELLIVSFDRVAGESMGIKAFWIDLLLLLMISLTIVISLRAVGNILVVAMLVTPAATARLLTDRLPVMLLFSSAIGVLSGIGGLFISYHADVAAGGTIVLVATGAFAAVWLFAPEHGLIMARVIRRRVSDSLGEETTVIFESPQILPPSN
jgi:manganese/iron transport system permease protein